MNKLGRLCTALGLMLLAAAIFLTAYNLRTDTQAGDSAKDLLDQLEAELDSEPEPAQRLELRSETGRAAETDSSAAPTDAAPLTAAPESTVIPDYILNPEMDMPEKTVKGQRCIGVLRIPALSLELPVINDWSYARLRIAPCRYTGSAYQDNLVIFAHNYTRHFGRLKNLSQGDEVIFTDVDGNVFRYEVVELETLSPYAVDDMTSGDWDLTMFTCTVGGKSRVTVRCERVNDLA